MVSKYVWKSPNGIWTICDFSVEGTRANITIIKNVSNGPDLQYNILIRAHNEFDGYIKGAGLTEIPDYVLDKAKSLMLAKRKSAAKKR